MRIFRLSMWCVFILITACEQQPAKRFQLIPASKSGISFNNEVEETLEFNVLDYQYMYNGGGVGIGDFNKDGLSDIYFTGNLVANKLYLNEGDFKFTDISEVAKVEAEDIWSAGVAVIDINNDGWQDVYVSGTFHEDENKRINKLFINQGVNKAGIPTFIEEAEKYGIADNGYSTNSVFFDYDKDGDLDLYVLTNVLLLRRSSNVESRVTDGSSPTTDQLYRNNGDGTFTNVSKEAGILVEGFGLGINVLDINQDNYPDLYISNDFITNDVLYLNNGDGTFSNQYSTYFKHQSYSSMGNDVADLNGDAQPDLMTLDMLPASNQRIKQMFAETNYNFYDLMDKRGYEQQQMKNCLQISNGTANYGDLSQMNEMAATDWSWSVLMQDYDNDGKRDIFITNGFPRDLTDKDFADFRKGAAQIFETREEDLAQIPIVKIRNYVYQQTGDLAFKDVSIAWGIEIPSFSNGAAFADLDNDGDLDYIINNINDKAFLYRNNTQEQSPQNYIKIALKGTKDNIGGIGAKVAIQGNGEVWYQEFTPYRGYLSSVEPILHFGLGDMETIEKISIKWSDGNIQIVENISANQTLQITYASTDESSFINSSKPPLLSGTTTFDYKHDDPTFYDWRIQPLLPHLHSADGPSISVGDINGDGLEDMFVGQGRYKIGQFFIQKSDGSFSNFELADTAKKEDTGTLLFDADNDGDLDLYIASGSSEFLANSWHFKDRFFENQGNLRFIDRSERLPDINIASSCVKGADYDQDGDIDLFIGGRLKPQHYPMAERSVVLENNNGVFTDVTEKVLPELMSIGMVTDAIWTDIDNDTWMDLIVVGDWIPITIFKNNNGTLENQTTNYGLNDSEGWWNAIAEGDFDNDGDMDYIVGNQGLNNRYNPQPTHPLQMVSKDFDNNQTLDFVISSWKEGAYYPIHLKKDLIKQLNHTRKRFQTFKEYGAATMDEILTGEELDAATHYKTTLFESIYLENDNSKLVIKPLPRQAQVAPINGIVVKDVNADGNLDVLMVGNDYTVDVFSGRCDAFSGLVLLGNNGEFIPQNIKESGFFVNGDARDIAQLNIGDGTTLIIATQNKDKLSVHQLKKIAE